MNYYNFNLSQKLQEVNQYLVAKLDNQSNYQILIDSLNQVLEDWRKKPVKITIISHSEVYLKNIKTLKESNLKLRSLCRFKTATLPSNLDRIIRNCDLLCLVNDGAKKISKSEQKLINKIATANITSYCLIVTDDTILSNKLGLKVPKNNNLPSYLTNKEFQKITSYLLPRIFIEKIDFEQNFNEYHQFLESIVEACLIKTEEKLRRHSLDIVNVHFKKHKGQYFSQINEQKSIFTPNQRLDRVKQEINKSSNQTNKLIQSIFKQIKQELNQSKPQLTNPFMYDTMMYRIQSAIQNASVIQYKEKNQVYLSLVIKNKNYNQSIHSYIMESCQEELDLWLERQWNKIDNNFESGSINELVESINQKLNFLEVLVPEATVSKIENQFAFDISDYVNLSILEENNKTIFNHHYTQSAWFKIILVLLIVGIVFIFTDKIFGFIILFIQILNLFTGRDPKKIKLQQQTKEIKRIMDSKCQFLVRFLADKFLQNLCHYLEEQSQEYQQEVSLITQQAEQELDVIKQKIGQHKEQIEILKKDQVEVIKILRD